MSELEFPREVLIEMGNEIPPSSKVPSDVRAARNREVRQTPQRKPTTQIWHENELPICKAFCETTLSRDFWFNDDSIFLSISPQNQRTQNLHKLFSFYFLLFFLHYPNKTHLLITHEGTRPFGHMKEAKPSNFSLSWVSFCVYNLFSKKER